MFIFRKDNCNMQNKKTTDYKDVQNWISVNGTKMNQCSQSSKQHPEESILTTS